MSDTTQTFLVALALLTLFVTIAGVLIGNVFLALAFGPWWLLGSIPVSMLIVAGLFTGFQAVMDL